MPRKTDKRLRLIEAAEYLIHKQGFSLTTLADIAQQADIPLGNVYYYFKTKDAIAVAVLESRAYQLSTCLQKWEQRGDTMSRLVSFLKFEIEQANPVAMAGCPIGSLCQELAKQGGDLSDAAAQLLNKTLYWLEKQFRALGFGQRAGGLSTQLIALIQGTVLLTNVLNDTRLTSKMIVQIEEWLRDLRVSSLEKQERHVLMVNAVA